MLTPAAVPLIIVFLIGQASQSVNMAAAEFNVKDFGAKGDGVNDEYPALQAAAAAVCATSNATLLFPPGNYRIKRYRITSGPARNAVQHIQFRNCRGTRITGYQAHIYVEGSFHRAADQVSGSLAISYSENVIPFQMINSSDFTIAGFWIDGGVTATTRDSRVVESTTAGIYTTNCRNYILKDLDVHHFASDGITLGGSSVVADRNATVINVSSHNNGRQGLSVIQLFQGSFVNSRFYETGRTGPYGAHLPAAGVDVEPVRGAADEDVATGRLIFDRCRFADNIGAQFISEWPSRVDSITVRSSYVEATHSDSQPIAYLNAAARGITEDTDFVFNGRHGIMFAPDRKDEQSHLSLCIYQNNRIKMDHPDSLYSPPRVLPVVFKGNNVSYYNRQRRPIRLNNFQEVSANGFIVHADDTSAPVIINSPKEHNGKNVVTIRGK